MSAPVVHGWYEREDGSEVEAELRYHVEPYQPATYWQPAEGGTYVDELVIDGVTVDENAPQYERLVDQLLEQTR